MGMLPTYEALPSSLMDSNVNLNSKTTEEQVVGACSLAHNILGVKGCARALR